MMKNSTHRQRRRQTESQRNSGSTGMPRAIKLCVKGVSYTNKQYCCSYCWRVVKPFIAVLVMYKSRLGAMGAPYNG